MVLVKIINVYDKNSNILCHGKNVFDTTKRYLYKFPKEYSECYYHNLNDLLLFEVDRMTDETMTAYYDSDANKIFYVDKNSLGQEMFHMASNDMVNNQYAFESKMDLEAGLIEGMTEYLAMKAYGLSKPGSYSFEVFCVQCLKKFLIYLDHILSQVIMILLIYFLTKEIFIVCYIHLMLITILNLII